MISPEKDVSPNSCHVCRNRTSKAQAFAFLKGIVRPDGVTCRHCRAVGGRVYDLSQVRGKPSKRSLEGDSLHVLEGGELSPPIGGGGGVVEVAETFVGRLKGVPKRRTFHHKMKVLALVDQDPRKFDEHSGQFDVNKHIAGHGIA